MKSYSAAQEKIFDRIDVLIDSDVEVWGFIQENVAFRKQIWRNFPGDGKLSSAQVALREYGFDFSEDVTSISYKELYSVLYVDDMYRVSTDNEFVAHLSSVSGLGESEIRTLAITKYGEEFRMIALEKFVDNNDEDYLSDYGNYRDTVIRQYIRKEFGGMRGFREAFNISSELNSYRSSQGARFYTDAGRRFEALVKRCFDESRTYIDDGYFVEGCYPDFVSGEEWFDAKLSKSTAFSPSCETIQKYTKHTAFLTLIYAVDDMSDVEIPSINDNVRLVNIFDYFPDIPDSLRTEIGELIAEVQRRKGLKIS